MNKLQNPLLWNEEVTPNVVAVINLAKKIQQEEQCSYLGISHLIDAYKQLFCVHCGQRLVYDECYCMKDE
jgi:hypothetical protein